MLVVPHSPSEELTLADIKLIAASIYEPQPRVWIGSRWQCPQCCKVNEADMRQCSCGITRDGLPEFVHAWKCPLIVRGTSDRTGDDQRAARDDPQSEQRRGEEPSPVLTGALISIIPAVLTSFGLTEIALKIWAKSHGWRKTALEKRIA